MRYLILFALALQGCATGGQWDYRALSAASEAWQRTSTPLYYNPGAPSLNAGQPAQPKPVYNPLRVNASNPYGY